MSVFKVSKVRRKKLTLNPFILAPSDKACASVVTTHLQRGRSDSPGKSSLLVFSWTVQQIHHDVPLTASMPDFFFWLGSPPNCMSLEHTAVFPGKTVLSFLRCTQLCSKRHPPVLMTLCEFILQNRSTHPHPTATTTIMNLLVVGAVSINNNPISFKFS